MVEVCPKDGDNRQACKIKTGGGGSGLSNRFDPTHMRIRYPIL